MNEVLEEKDKLWHLERFNVIKALSMDERMALRNLAKMKAYKQGETIYLPSKPSKHVYFLKEGNIRVSRVVDSGEEQVTDVIGPGELFGCYIFTSEGDTSEVAVALQDSLICYLDVNTWNNFIADNPKFSFRVLKLIGLKMRRLETRVERLQFLSITDRIRTVLKDLTDKHAKDVGNSKELKLNLTHQDIGRLAGTSRQSVTTTLRELQRQGVISYDRKKIIVQDYDRLEQVVLT